MAYGMELGVQSPAAAPGNITLTKALYWCAQRGPNTFSTSPVCCGVLPIAPFLIGSESFELERAPTGYLVQLPNNEQGQLQLSQVFIQPNLGCLQGWGTHYLSGQPVQPTVGTRGCC